MKRVLFLTTYASPYRVNFFDKLGEQVDLTVLYSDLKEKKTHRSAEWFISGEGKFQQVQLNRRIFGFRGKDVCTDVIDWMKKPFDVIIVGGYSAPTVILAIAYMRLNKIPFLMEVDGGLIRQDSAPKYRFKKMLVSSASGWLSSGKSTTDYLVHYGAKREHVYEYPFTSLKEEDLQKKPLTPEEKAEIRKKLGIEEEKMVLSIGQFIHRKGFDVLLKAAASVNAQIYIVGGEPTEEYLQMHRELGLENVHFLGFMKKDVLTRYYQAADLFVLPTREDIWGLVINEAMAYGLPVITTDRCVAGLELVENGVNGYIVPVGDHTELAEKMNAVLNADYRKMGEASLEKIQPYTIENMAKTHVEIFENGR